MSQPKFDSIQLLLEGGIARLQLNRPQKRNAFDEAMLAELTQALTYLSSQRSLRVLILAAAGPDFCAGADLAWMQRMAAYSTAENQADARALADCLAKLAHLPCPTIANIHGRSFGGGLGLIACCDLAIATPDSIFCFSEAKLGLIPATIAPYVVRAIGTRAAQRYFLTADAFNAATAQAIGLIHEVAEPDAGQAQIQAWIKAILQNGPHALALTKQLIASTTPIEAELVEHTATLIAAARTSAEGQAGMKAFFSQGKPPWHPEG